jgi:ACT domain-containing protein
MQVDVLKARGCQDDLISVDAAAGAKALYKDRTHEVRDICQALHISRSTLYRYLALPDR